MFFDTAFIEIMDEIKQKLRILLGTDNTYTLPILIGPVPALIFLAGTLLIHKYPLWCQAPVIVMQPSESGSEQPR